jgi:8-oxo-dGTP diphosphatase
MKWLWHYIQSAIGLILRHPVTGTSIIPVLPNGQIVLIKRRDTGRWGLPGGMVNWREDLNTSVERELAEETGLDLVKVTRLVGVYSAPDRDPRFHSICIVVEVEAKGTLQIQDTLEITDVKAFAPTDIPLGMLSHDHDQQLQDYFRGLTTLA